MSYYSAEPRNREQTIELLRSLGFSTALINKHRVRLEKDNLVTYYTFTKQWFFDKYNRRLGTGLYNLLQLYNVILKEKKRNQ